MKSTKLLLALFAIVCWPSFVHAQTENSYIPYRNGNKWGYCDYNKKIIIKPVYDSVSWFISGDSAFGGKEIAVVQKSGKFGLIGKTGKILLPITYDRIITDNFVFNGEKYYRKLLFIKKSNYYRYNKQTNKLRLIPDADFGDYKSERLIPIGIDCESTEKRIELYKYAPDRNLVISEYLGYDQNRVLTHPKDSVIITADTIQKVPCSSQLLFIKKDKAWGLFTVKGISLIKNEFDTIYKLSGETIFAASKNNKWEILHVNHTTPDSTEYVKKNQVQYDEIRDLGPESMFFAVRTGKLWGISFQYFMPDIFLGTTLYKRYINIWDKRLVGVYNDNYRLVGYVSYEGLKYWN